MVMNPRQIEECVRSIAALDIDKVWMTGYEEYELIPVIAEIVESTSYDRYLIVSDDVVVPPPSLEAIRHWSAARGENAVITGWCNLDMTDSGLRFSNVIRTPFTAPYESTIEQYDWVPSWEILNGEPLRLTWFAGLCMTSMTREQWQRFPFDLYGSRGCCSDFQLSWRLQEAGVPVLAARDASAFHVKQRTGHIDEDPRKALIRLGRFAKLTWET